MTKKQPMAGAQKSSDPEGDPKRGDEILKRMLQTKPRQHSEMIKDRKAKRSDVRQKKTK